MATKKNEKTRGQLKFDGIGVLLILLAVIWFLSGRTENLYMWMLLFGPLSAYFFAGADVTVEDTVLQRAVTIGINITGLLIPLCLFIAGAVKNAPSLFTPAATASFILRWAVILAGAALWAYMLKGLFNDGYGMGPVYFKWYRGVNIEGPDGKRYRVPKDVKVADRILESVILDKSFHGRLSYTQYSDYEKMLNVYEADCGYCLDRSGFVAAEFYGKHGRKAQADSYERKALDYLISRIEDRVSVETNSLQLRTALKQRASRLGDRFWQDEREKRYREWLQIVQEKCEEYDKKQEEARRRDEQAERERAMERPRPYRDEWEDDEEDDEEEVSAGGSRDTASGADDSHDLRRLPYIIYDGSNNEWRKQYMQGDAVVYKEKESGQTITIYHGTVYSGSANTSAGDFHWY